MNASLIFIFCCTAMLYGFFPTIYMIGWFVTAFPMYFVILKESARKACKLSDKQISASFERHEDETLGSFLVRRTLVASGWALGTLVIYWFMVLYLLVQPSKVDHVTDEIAKAIVKGTE